jgi:hypothetical protein
VGEPKRPCGPVAAAETGARWWATAAAAQRLTRSEGLDHAGFYDLAAELVATLRSLEDLADTLARQVGGYGRGRRLRDDTGADPAARLGRAMAEAAALRINLTAAIGDGERFWSAVGHIGLHLPPQNDPSDHDPGDRSSQVFDGDSDMCPRGLW